MKVDARIEALVQVPAEGSDMVVIARLDHKVELKNGVEKVLPEIILVGDQPHQQGHPGPVKRLASPYRGVSFHSCTQRWRSRIKHGSKSEHLGYFCSDVEAAHAYNEAAIKIHGNGAQLNEGVDLVIKGTPSLKTTVVDTTKVPYDGQTFYMDQQNKNSKPRVVPQRAQGVSTPTGHGHPIKSLPSGPPLKNVATRVNTPVAHTYYGADKTKQEPELFKSKQVPAEPLDFFFSVEEDPLSACGTKLDFGAAVDRMDDMFLEYWFNEANPLGFASDSFYDDRLCGRGLKRPVSFTLDQPLKRIRA